MRTCSWEGAKNSMNCWSSRCTWGAGVSGWEGPKHHGSNRWVPCCMQEPRVRVQSKPRSWGCKVCGGHCGARWVAHLCARESPVLVEYRGERPALELSKTPNDTACAVGALRAVNQQGPVRGRVEDEVQGLPYHVLVRHEERLLVALQPAGGVSGHVGRRTRRASASYG